MKNRAMKDMYYMFRNEKRMNRLQASNTVLRVFWVLSIIALIVGIVLFAGALALWFVVFILLAWTPTGREWMNGLLSFVSKTGTAVLIVLGIFAVVWVIRFVTEWLAVLSETRELKENEQQNRPFLDIAAAVKRVKLCNLIAFAVTIGLAFAMAAIAGKLGADGNGGAVAVVFGIVAIGVLIAKKIYAKKQFSKVRPQIAFLHNERYYGGIR